MQTKYIDQNKTGRFKLKNRPTSEESKSPRTFEFEPIDRNIKINGVQLKPEIRLPYEHQLINDFRLTDSEVDKRHDVFTVTKELVASPKKFFEILGNVIGDTFLKYPFE